MVNSLDYKGTNCILPVGFFRKQKSLKYLKKKRLEKTKILKIFLSLNLKISKFKFSKVVPLKGLKTKKKLNVNYTLQKFH